MLRVWIHEMGGPETDRFVRFADEHGITVGLSEERDGAQRHSVLLTELARRMDEAHGGFTPIDDGNALELVRHKCTDEAICG